MRTDDAVRRWREMSRVGSRSARLLFESGDFRGCANRAYYSVYHAATSLCVARGVEFPHGWNNPSHDQLPELIHNDGSLSVRDRRTITRLLRSLRDAREVADYRPGRELGSENARDCLFSLRTLLKIVEIDDD